MGLLVDGAWQDEDHVGRTQNGHFIRPATRFRNWITADGEAGPSGDGGFPAARGRGPEVDRSTCRVCASVTTHVYPAGCATTHAAQDEAVATLLAPLGQREQRRARQRYLAGAPITEADWRLFTTLVRFDAVYY